MIRALLATVLATAVSAADPTPAPTMLIELVRDEAVVAALRVPLSGGRATQDIAGLGRLSVRCPAPVTAGEGVLVYREVAIELIEPGDHLAVTTALSATFTRGGERKEIARCARGRFLVRFPE